MSNKKFNLCFQKGAKAVLVYSIILSVILGSITGLFNRNIAFLNTNAETLGTQMQTSSEYALKISAGDTAGKPMFLQKAWLNPGEEYAISYYYSLSNSTAEPRIYKGTDLSDDLIPFATAVSNDEAYKRVTCIFNAPDLTDEGVTVQGDKVMVLAGLGVHSAGADEIFYGISLFSLSDKAKTNIFTDTDYQNIGSDFSSGKNWCSLSAGVASADKFARVALDSVGGDEIFKRADSERYLLQINKKNNDRYVVQAVWLEAGEEYAFSYCHAKDGEASDIVLSTGDKDTLLDKTATFYDDDWYKTTVRFDAPLATDTDVTVNSDGRVKVYVGIVVKRAIQTNLQFFDLKLYKTSHSEHFNLLTDTTYTKLGKTTTDTENVWVSFSGGQARPMITSEAVALSEIGGQDKFIRPDTDKYALKISTPREHPWFLQEVWLEPEKTYTFSYYHTVAGSAAQVGFFLGAVNEQNPLTADSNVRFVGEYYNPTYQITMPALTAENIVTNDKGQVQLRVGVRVYKTSSNDTTFYGLKLYESDDIEKCNLLADQFYTKIGTCFSEDPNNEMVWKGCWSYNHGANRFYRVTLASVGGMDTFKIPADLNALKVVTNARAYIGQWVPLQSGKTYVYSWYATPTLKEAAYALEKDDSWEQSFTIDSGGCDTTWVKWNVEFTPVSDEATDANAEKYGLSTENGVVWVFVGFCPQTSNYGYFYSPAVYEKGDDTQTNLLKDPGFNRLASKAEGGCWYNVNETTPSSRFTTALFSSVEGGMDAFKQIEVGKGTGSYVLESNGVNNPFLLQKVSLDTSKTYSLSCYSTNGAFALSVYTKLESTGNYLDGNALRIVSDKEWFKKTYEFQPPEAGENGTVADPYNPGHVYVYVGVRAIKGTPGYCYGITLTEVDKEDGENILLDSDFEYVGYTWFQFYWENLSIFSFDKKLTDIGGIEYFLRPRGEDIPVPAGPKMMSYYCRSGGNGRLTIELPYTVQRGETTGKNYVVTLYIRPTYNRDPKNFYTSDYEGNPTRVVPVATEGYKYTFHLQERYNFSLLLEFLPRSTGYISGLEMYEADKNFNIIGTENLATFFGKNGTFDDWTVQSGLRWLDLSGRMEGTYPADPAPDYTGPSWTGELSPIPTDYFYIPDPGEWWTDEDVAHMNREDAGSVIGKITDASGKALSNITVTLSHISGEHPTMMGKTNKDGNFKIENVPLGGYDLSVIDSSGLETTYTEETLWIEYDADIITLSLVLGTETVTTITEDFSDTEDSCKISGYITDKKGNPISHLTLKLEPFGETVVTDENGYFEFVTYNTGEGKVYIISATGNAVHVVTLNLAAGMVYELRTSTSTGAIVYDAVNETVSLGVAKKPTKKPISNDGTFNYLPIIIAAIAVVLAGITVLIIVFIKKRSRKKEV